MKRLSSLARRLIARLLTRPPTGPSYAELRIELVVAQRHHRPTRHIEHALQQRMNYALLVGGEPR